MSMNDQIRLLPGEDPDEVISRAYEVAVSPVDIICLFSGGGDSTVLAHRCREDYNRLAFIDTGTAAPGVIDFVKSYAEWLGKPLTIMSAGDAYERMVLGGTVMKRGEHAGQIEDGFGFPGRGHHNKAYSRLKERQIEALLKEAKEGHPRNSTVIFLSGIRRAESQRRAKRESVTKRGGAVFCNPLIDWTDREMEEYRRWFGLPKSEPAALMHRSMECNCGAFADAEDERQMMQALWPTWWEETFGRLEREAEARGIKYCRWGGYDKDGNQAGNQDVGEAGLLCSSCEFRQISMEGVA